jgi:hypothetical protein
MDSATADTVSAQPELQLLLCLAAIANALNGELQPRTFRAAVSRKEAKRQLEVASDLLSLLSAQRSVQPPAGRNAGSPCRIEQLVKPTEMRRDLS